MTAMVTEVPAALAGVAAGAWSGFHAGIRWGWTPWRYRGLNAAAFIAYVGLSAAGLVFESRWLAVLALGMLAGLLTGMKYGVRGGFLPRGTSSLVVDPKRLAKPAPPKVDAHRVAELERGGVEAALVEAGGALAGARVRFDIDLDIVDAALIEPAAGTRAVAAPASAVHD